MKQCNTCFDVKSISEFHYHPLTRDKVYGFCKDCRCEKQRLYIANNPHMMNSPAVKRAQKIYWEKNKEAYRMFYLFNHYFNKDSIAGGYGNSLLREQKIILEKGNKKRGSIALPP